jgi:putative SOS response-associated peptidase YedK
LADKPFFRSALKQRRCLIPSSGFFEWKKAGRGKQPYFIHPRDEELFAFAGLWETWDKGKEPVQSCTIITTDANSALRPLHDRMPVILPPESFAEWLDPLAAQPELLDLLRPCPAEWLALHPVGAGVGNVRNDGPELVEPLAG